MTPYKNFLTATKSFFESNAFLKFLLSAYIFVIATGGLLFLLGLFILQVYEAFVCIGSILIWAGLILCIIREDALTIVISSGVIALGGLVAWFIGLIGRAYFFSGVFLFTPFFYFLIFCAIGIVVLVKAQRFKQIRAASAPKATGYACPRCGGFVSTAAAFCPSCGAKRPDPQPYAPPAQPYAPPAQPYAPPAQPYATPAQPYAPPAQPYAPPAQPYAPPAQPYAPTVQPYEAPAAPIQPQTSPIEPAVPVTPAETVQPEEPAAPQAEKKCASCGADLPEDAVFCKKCGAKQ